MGFFTESLKGFTLGLILFLAGILPGPFSEEITWSYNQQNLYRVITDWEEEDIIKDNGFMPEFYFPGNRGV